MINRQKLLMSQFWILPLAIKIEFEAETKLNLKDRHRLIKQFKLKYPTEIGTGGKGRKKQNMHNRKH